MKKMVEIYQLGKKIRLQDIDTKNRNTWFKIIKKNISKKGVINILTHCTLVGYNCRLGTALSPIFSAKKIIFQYMYG